MVIGLVVSTLAVGCGDSPSSDVGARAAGPPSSSAVTPAVPAGGSPGIPVGAANPAEPSASLSPVPEPSATPVSPNAGIVQSPVDDDVDPAPSGALPGDEPAPVDDPADKPIDVDPGEVGSIGDLEPLPPGANGLIRITDPAPGWAGEAGGTTGGGTELSRAVVVNTMAELQQHASGTDPKIVLLEPGEYVGALLIGANKTIIGIENGVLIKGYIQMRADRADNGGTNLETHNIIIRNLAVQGDPCSDLESCRSGEDAIYMGYGAHHIWLDHLDVYDGQDGNCDATRGADYMTVSWTQFRYTYDKPHRFSNLIAGNDDEEESVGKLKMTYMNCWWGERVEQRQPRGRFGDVHVFNNLHNSKLNPDGKQYAIGPGYEMSIIVENSVFDMAEDSKAIKTVSYTTNRGPFRGVLATGNIGHTKGTDEDAMNTDLGGKHFTIPYKYELVPATEVEARVTNPVCGAGNTCVLER